MKRVYKHKAQAQEQLEEIWENPRKVQVIHYSCESFYDKPVGSSRVATIAIRNLGTTQTNSFSVIRYCELKGLTQSDIKGNYKELEREVLMNFFKFIKKHQHDKWLHWNMRNDIYGFQALELRYKILKGKPFCISDANKIDLSQILVGIYGDDYIDDSRMEELRKFNKITNKGFRSGEDEAELFEQGEFALLHQSTSAKVDLLARFCRMANERTLKTKTTPRKNRWFRTISLLERISNNSLIGFLFSLIFRSTRGGGP